MKVIDVKSIYEANMGVWDEMSLNKTPALATTIKDILNFSGKISNLRIVGDKNYEGDVRDIYVELLNSLCADDNNFKKLKEKSVIVTEEKNSNKINREIEREGYWAITNYNVDTFVARIIKILILLKNWGRRVGK